MRELIGAIHITTGTPTAGITTKGTGTTKITNMATGMPMGTIETATNMATNTTRHDAESA
jgi:hypothetical protein